MTLMFIPPIFLVPHERLELSKKNLQIFTIGLRTTLEQLQVHHRKNSRDSHTPQETQSVVEHKLPESAAQAETDDRRDQWRSWRKTQTGESGVRLITDYYGSLLQQEEG